MASAQRDCVINEHIIMFKISSTTGMNVLIFLGHEDLKMFE